MEQDASSRAEEQSGPPVLPIKQHKYSRSSSMDQESEQELISPFSPQHQVFAYTDVFSEPIDCHAAQCPIHQRYDPSRCHQERFFSDGTPPPIPQKKLARTMSLPGVDTPKPSFLLPTSPLSLHNLHRNPHNYDNPLYMLGPIRDTLFHKERQAEPSVRRSSVLLPSLVHLSFDTPDGQLPYFFSSFTDRDVVSQRIQQRHLLFLKSAAQQVEAGILLQGEAIETDLGSYQTEDFLPCGGCMPRQIGDSMYYALQSHRFPKRLFGARVQKPATSPSSAHPITQTPLHINLQDIIVQFQPDSIQKNQSTPSSTQEPLVAFGSERTSPRPPFGGSIESSVVKDQFDFTNLNPPTVLSLLQCGYSVSIERDLPQVTLEDYLQESFSVQSELYGEQLCILLLQVVTGLHHLWSSNRALEVELRPRHVFLVWPSWVNHNPREEAERERSSTNPSTTVRGSLVEETGWNDRYKLVHMRWRRWGAPRVVLSHQPHLTKPPHTLSSINAQVGALIQHCLHPGESLAPHTQGSSTDSPHKKGLLDLASWLQDETSGLQMSGAQAVIQALLWGPRDVLFTLNITVSIKHLVDNWLSIRRALLVMKMAERGLVQDQSPLQWEDWLYMKYLAFSDSETVIRVMERLGAI